MTATTTPHSVPAARGDELHQLAVQLYGLIGSGHDALAYNVDARGPALTAIGADGKRRPVQAGGGGIGTSAPPWQRARELRPGGGEVDRRFNAWVLERHLRGKYAVAPAAPGWVQWVALDIDAHPTPDAPEHVGRRLARACADRVLAGVWRALHCSAERHPLVQRSPGGGYHVWFPLTRGPTSTNPEHTWPAAVARAWFERHLSAAGLELAPGVLEVFPSGRCLRAPCGLGMQVLQATRPDDPDALGLVPWPGTITSSERVDWRGDRASLSTPVRRVVPMVRTFVSQWEAQRRTLAEWLGRPEASWDPAWGFLGWRAETGGEIRAVLGPGVEEIPPEKNAGTGAGGICHPSQESDDVLGRPGGRKHQRVARSGWRLSRGRVGRARSGSDRSSQDIFQPPFAQEVDVSPDPAGDRVVRGRAFKEKVRRLLEHGVTEPSTRHDAVLTLAFYWGATCGREAGMALSLLEAWCKAHPHTGSRLAARPRMFLVTCVREAAHYLAYHAAKWKFRGHGDGGGLVTLAPADQAVIAAADHRVRDEIAAILAWLAGRTDATGRIGAPVQISTGLLARVCGGDRRVVDAGKRRRATTMALEELERLGVLTLAQNYVVGQHGREWSCWYQFGSGELPRTVELSAAAWAELVPPPVTSLRTSAAVPSPAAATSLEPRQDAPGGSTVVVRVIGERSVPEGLVRVLSDGTRGVPRTLLAPAPDVARPTAVPSTRAPWFVRMFQRRTFTPAELWTADVAKVIPFPDLEARRRMTRRERLSWGAGTPAPVIPIPRRAGERGGSSEAVVGALPAVPDQVMAPDPPPPSPHASLVAEVGDAAATLPLDLVDVVAQAWRAFRRGRDP
jgi:hypothetical protein